MRQRRSGFTLFQLAAAMAVVLVLIGLLLPAVQAIRAAAARMQSQNNLKQIGIAVHNYHDVHNRMPAGADANNYSCLVHLLPYVEQDNLFRTIDLTEDLDKSQSLARTALVKTFLSPLDPGARPATGPTNYMASAGSKAPLADNDGIFYRESATRFTDITDGTSNTVMFVETLIGQGGKKAVDVRRQHVRLKKADLKGLKDTAGVQEWKDEKNIVGDRGASWMDGRFLKATMSATRSINDVKPDVDCEGDGGLSGSRSMYEYTNVAICDGSVRVVSRSISLATWQAAATRAGGEVLGPDW